MATAIPAQAAQASTYFLAALGAPSSTDMIRAVAAWLKQESGWHITGNNPWNLHSYGGLPGQTGYRYAGPGDKNVAVFSTLQAGCTASAMNLERLAPSYGYGQVITAARSGNAIAFLDALASSSWSAGHYGGAGPNNKLRKIYAGLGGVVPASSATSAPPGDLASYDPSATTSVTLPFRDVFLKNFAGGGFTPATTLTAAWVTQYVLFEIETTGTGTPEIAQGNESALRAAASKYVGTAGSALPATITVDLHPATPGPLALESIVASVGDVVGGIVTHGILLLAIVALIVGGLYLVATSAGE